MSDDTQEKNVIDEPMGCQCTHEQGDSDCPLHVICSECGEDIGHQTVVKERARLAAEVRRLRNQRRADELHLESTTRERIALESDRDQLSASNLRLVAENERLRVELERRNVAHVEPAILSKDRDEWKARALAAEAERDRLKQQVDDLTAQLQSMNEQGQREAAEGDELKAEIAELYAGDDW